MSIAALKTFANVVCYIDEDVTTTAADGSQIKVSTSDAEILQSWVQHFDSDSCRLLIGNFATYDSQYYAFETFLVGSVNTSTGVVTLKSGDTLSGKANYTTAKNTFVSVNLIYDGEAEMFGVGGLVAGNCTAFKDFSNARVGSQSILLTVTNASGGVRCETPVREDENYYFSGWMKSFSNGHRVHVGIFDDTNASFITESSWFEYLSWGNINMPFTIPSGCNLIKIIGYGDAIGEMAYMDNFVLIQTPHSNPGMEDVGTELVENNDMSTDTWWTKGTGVTISGGTANLNNSTTSSLSKSGLPVFGYIYRLKFDLLNYVKGSCQPNFSGQIMANNVSANGSYDYILGSMKNGSLIMYGVGDHQFSLDNIYFKKYPSEKWGYIGSQTYISRMFYADGVNQRSGTEALKLTNSDTDNKVYFEDDVVAGEYYTLKFYAKATSGDQLNVKIYDLGAELVTNGGFTGSSSGWSQGTGWSYGSNNEDGTSASSNCYQTIGALSNTEYYGMLDITAYTSGSCGLLFSSSSLIPNKSTTGRYGRAATSGTINSKIYINGNSFTGTIDNVSVKEVKQSFTKTVTATSYTEYSLTFKAQGSFLHVDFYNSATTDITWVDDLVLMPLRKVTPSTETPSPASGSYGVGKWGTADYAFRVDGSDTLSITTAGRVRNDKGTFAANINMMPYDKYDDDVYLWAVEDCFKLYYDSTNYQWKFSAYNGSGWITASGNTMSHTQSGYYHIAGTWDNSSAIKIYVNQTGGNQWSGTWTAQTLPTNMFIGSNWDGTGQADQLIDDAVIYVNPLTATEISNLFD